MKLSRKFGWSWGIDLKNPFVLLSDRKILFYGVSYGETGFGFIRRVRVENKNS